MLHNLPLKSFAGTVGSYYSGFAAEVISSRCSLQLHEVYAVTLIVSDKWESSIVNTNKIHGVQFNGINFVFNCYVMVYCVSSIGMS